MHDDHERNSRADRSWQETPRERIGADEHGRWSGTGALPRVPTLAEVMAAYPGIAARERAKCERPCETTVRNVLTGVRAVLDGLGVDAARCRVTDLSRRRIDAFLAGAAARGLASVSMWSYVFSLRALAARWTRPYYEDLGWRVPPFDLPVRRVRVARYQRPDRRLLLRVREWYASLAARTDVRDWVAATLMLEFAMRNGDIRRLKWGCFRERNGGVFLCYMPHKTLLSSGRTVCWPVHPEIWRQLQQCRPALEAAETETSSARRGRPRKSQENGLVVPHADEVFRRLNRELRARRLFMAAKACYELRKICVDHVYQRFGAEAASSISGDDIRTVTRYYADPSAVSACGVRVVDLL